MIEFIAGMVAGFAIGFVVCAVYGRLDPVSRPTDPPAALEPHESIFEGSVDELPNWLKRQAE